MSDLEQGENFTITIKKQNTKTTQEITQMRNISPDTKRAADLFTRLSPADRQLIIALLKSLSSQRE